MAAGWEDAARRARVAEALEGAVDLSEQQYLALRQGRTPPDLDTRLQAGFVVERVGCRSDGDFQDAGVEYYRYVP